MPETIGYSWAGTSLGDILLAMSATGVVAVDFSADRAASERALRLRFADAEVREAAPDELSDSLALVVRAIETPGFEPNLALDLRGTAYEVQVWSMLRSIPAGQTTNYGALALQLGTRDARDVTAAIANNPIAVLVPCHRVIKKDGSLSGYRWGFQRKRELLRREHVASPSNPTPERLL